MYKGRSYAHGIFKTSSLKISKAQDLSLHKQLQHYLNCTFFS
ncbi:hypothetical Protein YC6258_00319 [Gynuella sunshinyii YC6258]|uniref:Uncharacterized protein n=1 Tax=Gynuella sunshinyii YC6258 TaxID=1445510 RepID=A0A0C5VQ15_9GAMM|nr:hypothetical Protein YC6258_00319 [Gynuella sunshinyii YC6258]